MKNHKSLLIAITVFLPIFGCATTTNTTGCETSAKSTGSVKSANTDIWPMDTKIITVRAAWNFGYTNKQYQGYGYSEAEALESARQRCYDDQNLDDLKKYCGNKPTSVIYGETQSCGDHQTDWITAGNAVGNPCPAGCSRGKQKDSETRIVDLGKIQTRYIFECWRP
ncbi:MAG: hypothetical protein EPN17_05060 [Methylobacter sp.]|nr:MAG: hypothetical protein EPN17_05060 [Methylobacter sp.]